ncbi:hypothetical protein [Clostridium ganghwense]|uniref:Uncharacterized protein n=1 Tax=Clostridium ganghwense TaxID=312089 RepID=A0ABT4CTN0_9CLOT|nr:hypothetical protein [Clostridium ganghwense]MCY6372430.1 hypothetical protein [Clostridium ganghwense]
MGAEALKALEQAEDKRVRRVSEISRLLDKPYKEVEQILDKTKAQLEHSDEIQRSLEVKLSFKEIRDRVTGLAAVIAYQEIEKTGKPYKEVIPSAVQEACIRLGIDKKEFISKCRGNEKCLKKA